MQKLRENIQEQLESKREEESRKTNIIMKMLILNLEVIQFTTIYDYKGKKIELK